MTPPDEEGLAVVAVNHPLRKQEQLWIREMGKVIEFYKGQVEKEQIEREKVVNEKEILHLKLQKAEKEILQFQLEAASKEGGVYQPVIGTGEVQQPLNVTKLDEKRTLLRLDEENNEEFVRSDEEYEDNLEDKKSKAQEQARSNQLEAARIKAAKMEAELIEAARVKYASMEDAHFLHLQHLAAERRCATKQMEQMDVFGWPLYYPQMDYFGCPVYYPTPPYCVIWHPVPNYGVRWY